MITFATVLKSGGIYQPEHVQRIQSQIKRFYGKHRFVCLSDVPEVPGYLPLEHGWPKWWSKLELFRRDLGRCCYFDLDVTIQSSLRWISKYSTKSGELWGMNDNLWRDNLNSSVMLWEGSRPEILKDFDVKQIVQWTRPPDRWVDQGWIQHHTENVQFLPDHLVSSYKFGDYPDASVLVYHGEPKPWDLV